MRGPKHAMKPLRWTEWIELVWRTMLVALLVWFGVLLRDIERVRQLDAAQMLAVHMQTLQRTAEQTRLIRAICLSTVTIYDAARGVCDATGTAEIKPPPLPALKGGPQKK